MSDGVLTPLLNTIGGIIAGVLVLAGGRFAARQSRQAAEATAQVESRRVDGAEWTSLVAELRREIDRANGNADRATASAERTREENVELRGRVQELEDREDAQREVLQIHAAWDHLATERLRAAQIDLDAPPPLTPPRPSTS